ncbi:MAG TPA: L,D-transpeptidase family protein [Mycobacteriales bacterium]|nr:L,D-transpeptidase family protein [Mycobacteriales bacterium]
MRLGNTHMLAGKRRLPTAIAAAGLLAGVGLAGCGGHGGVASDAASTPAPPLRVVAVTPHRLTATSPISVQFSAALQSDSPLPRITPDVAGSWHRSGDTATFTPSSSYPIERKLTITLAATTGARPTKIASRKTPNGSLKAAEEILARLHYLPLTTTAPTPADRGGERAAAYQPPPAGWAWRYGNIPSVVRAGWTPRQPGIVLRGAVIAFQHQAGLQMDGAIGPHTWSALMKADLAHQVDPDPYSVVSANLDLPQTLSVWVAGHTVLTSPVNGGVAGAPTPLGTFPVYERLTSTTMSGTNPDGSHYSDPGVPWVNYFSGGSAVHGFPRASYGSPQSVGCLELPIATADRVFHLIDYGTLVNVSGPPTPPAPIAHPAAPKPTQQPSHKPSHQPTHQPSHSPSPHHAASKSPNPHKSTSSGSSNG